jgi:hypothetical protein
MTGVEETGAVFAHDIDMTGVARFRHFGAEGPLYEILGPSGDDRVRIRVVHSGEELTYSTAAARQDPKA